MAATSSTPLSAASPLQIRVSEVISALSFALDLVEGQPMGHAVRSCVFGMHIAREIGLPTAAQSDLYYALLMKDAGCSTNASRMFQILGSDDIAGKRDVKTTDWTRVSWESLTYALSHVYPNAPFVERVRALVRMAMNQKRDARDVVQMRCERGAAIARRIGLSGETAEAIHSLDELWNGEGHPQGLRGEEIPLASRIMNLAQTLEIFYSQHGRDAAVEVARKRRGRWFDPSLVRAFLSLAQRETFWHEIEHCSDHVLALEPQSLLLTGGEATIDNICIAFADVIDAKSPFTYRHSNGVAQAAVDIAKGLSMRDEEVTLLRRAGLLHDIGKLSVSNAILDKPGKLTPEEWEIVRRHPGYSLEILRRVPGFGPLSELAAAHHEKLDGSGYFRNMKAEDMSLSARVLVVADMYDALAAARPYREAMPQEQVFDILWKDAPRALDADCVRALEASR